MDACRTLRLRSLRHGSRTDHRRLHLHLHLHLHLRLHPLLHLRLLRLRRLAMADAVVAAVGSR